MILVPFLFFCIICGYWWRKHGTFDVCVYMAGMYAITSLLAIILVIFDFLGEGGVLFDNGEVRLGVLPTVLYCVCIMICLLPFSLIYGKEVKMITIHAPWVIDGLSWMLITLSLLNLYLVADSTLDILQGDLNQIRSEAYAGVESPAMLKAQTLPFVVSYFYYFNSSTILCLPLLFFNICFRQKTWWFNALLFFASLSMPIVGIQQADRTEIVFYGEMLLFCLVFFYRFFSTKVKWVLVAAGIPLIMASVVYLVAVSQARFDTKNSSGAEVRALQYGGQGYLNFCYFYEHGRFDYSTTERVFPLVNHFVLHKESGLDRREERSGEQGFFMSVFATFLGDLMLDITPLGMMLWVIFYFLLLMLFLRRSHRETYDISELLFVFLMAIIPVFGIFYYRFFYFTHIFSLVLVIAVVLASNYKIVLK